MGLVMFIVKSSFLSLLCFFTISSYVSAQEIAVNFIANASIRITNGKQVIFTDFPYVSGAFGHMIYTYPYFIEQNNDVTTLITNRFADHLDPEKILTLDWKIIAPEDVVIDLKSKYQELIVVREAQLAEIKKNTEIQKLINPNTVIRTVVLDELIEPSVTIAKEQMTVGNAKVTTYDTPTAGSKNHSYLIDWGGKKIYLAGDTGDVEHLASLPPLDMAFISPWLFENARRANALPETKKLIIYQHKEEEIIPNCFTCTIPERGDFIPF